MLTFVLKFKKLKDIVIHNAVYAVFQIHCIYSWMMRACTVYYALHMWTCTRAPCPCS